MVYNYEGKLLYNSISEKFADNMELDYAYDSASNANYSVIRVFKTKKDGTVQTPKIIYPGFQWADVVAQRGYELMINAGLGWDGEIDGIAVENGVVVHNAIADHHAGSIPLIIDDDGTLSTVPANYTGEQAVAAGAVYATCGFCPIIENYENVASFPTVANTSHFTQNAQRQIIGQFGNGDYAIVTCAGRNGDNSDGWTLAEAQVVCKRLGLKFAYNLDGGTSTATYIKKHPVYDFMRGTSRVVPSFIVFGGTDDTNEFDPAVLLNTDVINHLESTVTNKPLSGNMGRVLDNKIGAIIGGTVPKGDTTSNLLPNPSSSNEKWQYYLTDEHKYAVSDGTAWIRFSTGSSVEENVIETVKVNGTALVPDSNKAVNITVPTVTTATAIADGDTGFVTGDQVYDYIDANSSSWGENNVIETVKVNGSALTPDANKAVDITIPTVTTATGVVNGDNGFVTGDQVYDYIDTHSSGWGGGDVNVIESISVNNITINPDANKNVNIPAPVTDVKVSTDAGQTWTSVMSGTEARISLGAGGTASGEMNVLESVSVNGVAQTISNKNVNISVPTVASAITNNDTGYATGDMVYDYITAHSSEWGGGDDNVIESISVNGSAQTITNKNVNITVPVVAQAVADNDNGYVTGDMMYDILGDLETFLSNY